MRVHSKLTSYQGTCFIACLLFAWTNSHASFAIAAPTHANEKARCVALAQAQVQKYMYVFNMTGGIQKSGIDEGLPS